ncbi:MAG: chromosomal replication initiator protein DnaA, partial [Oscillospiraceae bacterium]|nr:chromosomal replication initiator protein DnaA [Oscillospiraceae bacterium]
MLSFFSLMKEVYMKSFAEVFEKVLEYIHLKVQNNELTNVAYDLWISTMIPDKMDGNAACFNVQSDFQKNIVEKNYDKVIKEAFLNIMGFEVELVINTVEIPDEQDYEPQKKREELDKVISNGEYDYTFDTFIVGRSNEFAHAACVAVSKNRGGAYNPLFIHGPSGLGKTHLLTAISNFIKQNDPMTNVIYVTGEVFANELIAAIQTK